MGVPGRALHHVRLLELPAKLMRCLRPRIRLRRVARHLLHRDAYKPRPRSRNKRKRSPKRPEISRRNTVANRPLIARGAREKRDLHLAAALAGHQARVQRRDAHRRVIGVHISPPGAPLIRGCRTAAQTQRRLASDAKQRPWGAPIGHLYNRRFSAEIFVGSSRLLRTHRRVRLVPTTAPTPFSADREQPDRRDHPHVAHSWPRRHRCVTHFSSVTPAITQVLGAFARKLERPCAHVHAAARPRAHGCTRSNERSNCGRFTAWLPLARLRTSTKPLTPLRSFRPSRFTR